MGRQDPPYMDMSFLSGSGFEEEILGFGRVIWVGPFTGCYAKTQIEQDKKELTLDMPTLLCS
jgi:hypothetical protein